MSIRKLLQPVLNFLSGGLGFIGFVSFILVIFSILVIVYDYLVYLPKYDGQNTRTTYAMVTDKKKEKQPWEPDIYLISYKYEYVYIDPFDYPNQKTNQHIASDLRVSRALFAKTEIGASIPIRYFKGEPERSIPEDEIVKIDRKRIERIGLVLLFSILCFVIGTILYMPDEPQQDQDTPNPMEPVPPATT